MSRIADAFRKDRGPAFITYIMAGDPDPDTCVSVAGQLIEGGADILELGMPFSDPVADGPTIQRAGERALAAGANPDMLFSLVRRIRAFSGIPIVIMTYYNIVYRRGISAFYREAHDAGADGVLIVDMPPEEAEEALAAARAYGIDQIFLVAPTTTDSRLRSIAESGRGFLYLVSVLGVTGARRELSQDALVLMKSVRPHTTLPLAVGFGISTPEQAAVLSAAGADGIIVGSAIVDLIGKNLKNRKTMLSAISRFASEMSGAIKGAGRFRDRPRSGRVHRSSVQK
jgi:tryptophan synthase alpha chain